LVYPLLPVSYDSSEYITGSYAFPLDLAPDEISDLGYGQSFTRLFISPGQVLAFDPSD
jgi:hypothetical protein